MLECHKADNGSRATQRKTAKESRVLVQRGKAWDEFSRHGSVALEPCLAWMWLPGEAIANAGPDRQRVDGAFHLSRSGRWYASLVVAGRRSGLVGRGITWSKMRKGGWRLGGTLPGTISEEDFTSCVMDHGALSSAPRREGIFWPLPEE